MCVPFVLFAVNRYLFSWTGFLLNKIPCPFGDSWCDRKSVGVPVANGHPKILSFVVDLREVASAFKSKPNYYLIDFGGSVTAYRKFGNVWYYISLQNDLRDYKTVTKMKLGTRTPLSLWREGEPDVPGEKYTTPSGCIRNRVYRIINDLPVKKNQNAEIKKNVRVRCAGDFKLF